MTMHVRAALLDQDLTLTVGERELPDPVPGEALVAVEWAGVCSSDLHVLRSGDWVRAWPATLGHELFGRVAGCPGGEFPEGTPVVVDSRVPCGACAGCARGAQLCERLGWVGEVFPGGFATHCVLPGKLLLPVPEELAGPLAALAEPLAVVLHGLGKASAAAAWWPAPDRVLLLGHGPIGALAHVEAARRWPAAQVTVVEPAPLRAQLATAFGARTLPGLAEVPADGGRGFDLVVDAAGYPGSLRDALGAATRGGTVLLLALAHGEAAVDPLEVVQRSLTIVGSNGFAGELLEAVALLASEGWRYKPVVTDTVALDELPGFLNRQLQTPESVKALVACRT